MAQCGARSQCKCPTFRHMFEHVNRTFFLCGILSVCLKFLLSIVISTDSIFNCSYKSFYLFICGPYGIIFLWWKLVYLARSCNDIQMWDSALTKWLCSAKKYQCIRTHKNYLLICLVCFRMGLFFLFFFFPDLLLKHVIMNNNIDAWESNDIYTY